MASIYVPRSDSLEKFRTKFNQLSGYVFGIDDIWNDEDDSPTILSSVLARLDNLEKKERFLPFYDSTGASKDIPLKDVYL